MYSNNPYASPSYATAAIDAPLSARVSFLQKTYLHLFAAVVLFGGALGLMVSTPAFAEPLTAFAFKQWWVIMLSYMGISWVAQSMAASQASEPVQYAGLILYAIAEAVIFTPLLYILKHHVAGGEAIIVQAALITLLTFGGLTGVVFFTRQDFSFLRNFLWMAGLAALGLAFAGSFGVVSLGTWFVLGMIVLMCGYILFDTSNVLHHYPTTAHVAASLALFASMATLFWYVLRLVMAFRSEE
jgi:FtsH-binding integral membrane protein